MFIAAIWGHAIFQMKTNPTMWWLVLLLSTPVFSWIQHDAVALDCTGSALTPATGNFSTYFVAQTLETSPELLVRVLISSSSASVYTYNTNNAILQRWSDATASWVSIDTGYWQIEYSTIDYEYQVGDIEASSLYRNTTLLHVHHVLPLDSSWVFSPDRYIPVHTDNTADTCAILIKHSLSLWQQNIIATAAVRTEPYDPFLTAPTHLLKIVWPHHNNVPLIEGWYERSAAHLGRSDTHRFLNTTLWYIEASTRRSHTLSVQLDGPTGMIATTNAMLPWCGDGTNVTLCSAEPPYTVQSGCSLQFDYANNIAYDLTEPTTTRTYLANVPLFQSTTLPLAYATPDALLNDSARITYQWHPNGTVYGGGKTVLEWITRPTTNTTDSSTTCLSAPEPKCAAGMTDVSCRVLRRTLAKLALMDRPLLDATLVRLDNDTTGVRWLFVTAPDTSAHWSPHNRSIGQRHRLGALIESKNTVVVPCGTRPIYQSDIGTTSVWVNGVRQHLGAPYRQRVIGTSPIGNRYVAVVTSRINDNGLYAYGVGSVYFGDANGDFSTTPVLEYNVSGQIDGAVNDTLPVVAVLMFNPRQARYPLAGTTVVLVHCWPGHGVWRSSYSDNAGAWDIEDAAAELTVNETNVWCDGLRVSDSTTLGLEENVKQARLVTPSTAIDFDTVACTVDSVEVFEIPPLTTIAVPVFNVGTTEIPGLWHMDQTTTATKYTFATPMALLADWTMWTYHNVSDGWYDPSVPETSMAYITCDTNGNLLRGVIAGDVTANTTRVTTASHLTDHLQCSVLYHHPQTPMVGVVLESQTVMMHLGQAACSGDSLPVADPVAVELTSGVVRDYVVLLDNGSTTITTTAPARQVTVDPDGASLLCHWMHHLDYYSAHGAVEHTSDTVGINPVYNKFESLIELRTSAKHVHWYREWAQTLIGSFNTTIPVSNRADYVEVAKAPIPLLTTMGDYYNHADATCLYYGIWTTLYPSDIVTSAHSTLGSHSTTIPATVCPTVDTYESTAITPTTDRACSPIITHRPDAAAYRFFGTGRMVGLGDYVWNAYNTSANRKLVSTAFVNMSDRSWYDISRAALSDSVHHLKRVQQSTAPNVRPASISLVVPSLADYMAPDTTRSNQYAWHGFQSYTGQLRGYRINPCFAWKDNLTGILLSTSTSARLCPNTASYIERTSASTKDDDDANAAPCVQQSDPKLVMAIGRYGRLTLARSALGYRPAAQPHCFGATHHTVQTTGLCEPHRTCDVDHEYQIAEPTEFSDRTCAIKQLCAPSSEYTSHPGTYTTDRTCTSHPTCTVGQYVAAAATSSTARVCFDKTTECPHGSYYTPQQNAVVPGTVYLTPPCTLCDYGTTTFWYTAGNETFEDAHTFTTCVPSKDLVFPTEQSIYYSYRAFLASDGTKNPTTFKRSCRICYSTQIEIYGCVGWQNRVCDIGSLADTPAPTRAPKSVYATADSPTEPPTPCMPHQFYNTIADANICEPCTKCEKHTYTRKCTPNKDAACGTNSSWKYIHTALITLFSIHTFAFLYIITADKWLKLWLAFREWSITGPAPSFKGFVTYPARHHWAGRVGKSIGNVFLWPGRAIQTYTTKHWKRGGTRKQIYQRVGSDDGGESFAHTAM
jgi:hypothetical protein